MSFPLNPIESHISGQYNIRIIIKEYRNLATVINCMFIMVYTKYHAMSVGAQLYFPAISCSQSVRFYHLPRSNFV